MNIYFLVEGRRSERKIYPLWLSYIAPHLDRVNHPTGANHNNYYLISGEGYPSMLDVHLPNAIRDIESTRKYNMLVVILDADEQSVQDRIESVKTAVSVSSVQLKTAHLEVVVQNRCIETWLLGNRRFFSRYPQNAELRRYVQYYDVSNDDPELMPYLDDFSNHAQFHLSYLQFLFNERNTRYTKRNPGCAGDRTFFEELRRRVASSPNHIKTFARFLDLCSNF